MQSKAATVNEYLASLPADRRAALEALRAQIHRLAPGCEETISYSMPAFRWKGEVIAGFLATQAGCSYYPFSGTTLATLDEALTAYSKTKSAVHFDPATGLPDALVKKLLAARQAELPHRDGSRTPSRRTTSTAQPARAAQPSRREEPVRSEEPSRSARPSKDARPALNARPAVNARPAMNAEWHARHPMPRAATTPQRIQWHLDHERHCGCRPMPLKLRALMARGTKPGREPWRGPGKANED